MIFGARPALSRWPSSAQLLQFRSSLASNAARCAFDDLGLVVIAEDAAHRSEIANAEARARCFNAALTIAFRLRAISAQPGPAFRHFTAVAVPVSEPPIWRAPPPLQG